MSRAVVERLAQRWGCSIEEVGRRLREKLVAAGRADAKPGRIGGHFIGDRFIVFPHRCPGSGCAIWWWIVTHPWRLAHEIITPHG